MCGKIIPQVFVFSILCFYSSAFVDIFLRREMNNVVYANDANEMIIHDGFPLEVHDVVTDDGYILTLQRIPYGKNSTSNIPNKYPVILTHGLMGSAENSLIGGPDKAIAYVLASRGYDVWLMNSRGTWHSRKHKFLNPDEGKEFWQFSIHELGYYDLPAAIDYILDLTQRKKMHLIGHSQGTTIGFIMCSSRPEYNDKLWLMVQMAPSAILKHMKVPFIGLIAPMYPFLRELADVLRIYELLPKSILSNESARKFGKMLCIDKNRFDICTIFLHVLSLYTADQIDPETIPHILTSGPGGCSVYQTLHYAQLITKGKFQQYDWGREENLRRYNSTKPPYYNLNNVKVPTSLIYGEADTVVTKEDVAILYTLLPNVVDYYRVPYDKWTHLDFIWAKDIKTLLFDHMFSLMKEYGGV